MSTENTYPPDDSFSERLSKAFKLFLRVLLRLVIIALLLGAVAAALYFGFPYLYRQYILPVQNNTNQIAQIEARQQQDGTQVSQRIEQLQQRISDLEAKHTADRETISELKDRLTAAELVTAEQPNTLQRLTQAETRLDSAERKLREGQQADLAFQKEMAGPDSPLTSLSQEIEIVKAMQTLVRARFFLEQNNPGLALTEIKYARGILAALQPDAAADQKAVLEGLIQRLDLAAGNLPAYPVLAASDLEIAWQLLVAGPGSELKAPGAALTPAPTAAGTTATAAAPTLSGTPTHASQGQAATPTPKP